MEQNDNSENEQIQCFTERLKKQLTINGSLTNNKHTHFFLKI